MSRRGAGGKRDDKPADWFCKKCTDNRGDKFRNFGWRKECKECCVAKGKCIHSVVTPAEPAKRTLAAKQVQQQKQQDKLDRLRKENEKLKQKLKGVEGGKDTDDSDTEDDAGHEQEDELTLDVLRGMLKLVKASGKSDTCPHVLELQAKITAKEQAAWAEKPANVRMARADRAVAAAEKARTVVEGRQKKVAEELEKLQQRQKELEELHKKAEQDVRDAESQRAALLEELRSRPAAVETTPGAARTATTDPLQAIIDMCTSLPQEHFDRRGESKAQVQELLGTVAATLRAISVEEAQASPAALAASEPDADMEAPLDDAEFLEALGVDGDERERAAAKLAAARATKKAKKDKLKVKDKDKDKASKK